MINCFEGAISSSLKNHAYFVYIHSLSSQSLDCSMFDTVFIVVTCKAVAVKGLCIVVWSTIVAWFIVKYCRYSVLMSYFHQMCYLKDFHLPIQLIDWTTS